MLCNLLKNVYDNNLHSKLYNNELLEQNHIIGLQLLKIFKSTSPLTIEKHKSSVFYVKDNEYYFEVINLDSIPKFLKYSHKNVYSKLENDYNIGEKLFKTIIGIYAKIYLGVNHIHIMNNLEDDDKQNERIFKIEFLDQSIHINIDESLKSISNIWDMCTSVGKYDNINTLDFYRYNGVIWFKIYPSDGDNMIINIHMYEEPTNFLKNKYGYNENTIKHLSNQLFKSNLIPDIVKNHLDEQYYGGNIKINTVIGNNFNTIINKMFKYT